MQYESISERNNFICFCQNDGSIVEAGSGEGGMGLAVCGAVYTLTGMVVFVSL